MPRLRHRADGGCYIVGCVNRFSTWQLRQAGRDYLTARRISDDGDYVSVAEVQELVRRNWVFTAGGGPGQPGRAADALAEQLIAWAIGGGSLAGFEGGIPRDRWEGVFSRHFLGWLRRLDREAGWGWLLGVSAVSFETAACGRYEALEWGDDVHAELARRGAGFVHWRLGRLVGLADGAAIGVLGWLAGRLEDEPLPTGDTPPRVVPPRIVWQVDLQQVVGVLPEQHLSPSVRKVTWAVGDQPTVTLTASRSRTPERESSPLWPVASYRIEFHQSGGDVSTQRWEFEMPLPVGPVVLFHPSGELVDPGDPDALHPGEYLALARGVVAGVHVVGEIDVRPVGWVGWTGRRVRVTAGATIPGYRVSDHDPTARLELSSPPPVGLRWLGEEPVYVGALPVVSGGSTGAELVISNSGRSLPHRVTLRDGRPLNLNAIPEVGMLTGRFTLSLRWPSHPDRHVPGVSFIRLPAVTLAEVPDTVHPGSTTAVRVSGVGGRFTPAEGTDVREEGRGVFLLRSTAPETSPGVVARHSDGWEVRARLAVTRGCLIGPDGFGGWQPLPVRGVDLRAVGLNHLLRLEFVTPPATSDGRLVTRHSSGVQIFYGHGVGDPPRVFEVELHRWRDSFGDCGGRVQAFVGGRWADVAILEGEPAPPPPPPPEQSPVEVLLGQLNAAAAAERPVAGLVEHCLTLFAATPWADPLPLTAGRVCLAAGTPLPDGLVAAVTQLAARGDVLAAVPLAELLGVRSGGVWDFARVEQVRDRLNEHPDSWGVNAECWYRYARANPNRPTHRSQQVEDAGDLLRRHLRAGPVGVAYSEGVLLRELIDLLRGELPSDSTLEGVWPSHRRWAEVIRTAGRFVRTPLPQWTPRPVPSLGPPPAVLHEDDVALVRAVLELAAGDRCGADWESVRHRGRGFYTALPLLVARFTRVHADFLAAWQATQQDGPEWMTEVILAER